MRGPQQVLDLQGERRLIIPPTHDEDKQAVRSSSSVDQPGGGVPGGDGWVMIKHEV